MTDDERSFKERLEVRIALRKIDSAFDACNKLAEVDKQSLYGEIGNRLLQHIARGPTATHDPTEIPAPAAVTPPRFRDCCLELAGVAPTDDIRDVLLSIADLCEEMPEALEDPPSPDPQ
jgi:hypothetical protein